MSILALKSFEELFDGFCAASSLKDILLRFYQLCDCINLLEIGENENFYHVLRRRVPKYWKSDGLFAKLDIRANDKEYKHQEACKRLQVLVIGCGPCGLRCAIEMALMGASVTVVDKRTEFTRNNVLHFWPYLIHDLKSLGAKSFFGKFCAGSIDHLSIRTLQCILLKVACIFGVQLFPGVTFSNLVEPCASCPPQQNSPAQFVRTRPRTSSLAVGPIAANGWKAVYTPDHAVLSAREFDVIIGADGKLSALQFPQKELRCRLAVAVTVNFVNNNTLEENQVPEISGVTSIFNQQFFARMATSIGIELENIVYYKDETHYFVMTAKKRSLLSKRVFVKDDDDPQVLLSPNNVNQKALQAFALKAAEFATNNALTNLQFAVNAQGEPDVAVFDFTRMYAAEHACRIVERQGRPILQCLIGDALIEPFWPTGSGCALGFLSALDTAWTAANFAAGLHPLKVIAWRESIYQRLSQTTPMNMPQNFSNYTVNPLTRYSICDMELISPIQTRHLYISDILTDATGPGAYNRLRASLSAQQPIVPDGPTATSLRSPELPSDPSFVLQWFRTRLAFYSARGLCTLTNDFNSADWATGNALCCMLHRYRPDLLPPDKLLASIDATTNCNWSTDSGVDIHKLILAMNLFADYFNVPSPLPLRKRSSDTEFPVKCNCNSLPRTSLDESPSFDYQLQQSLGRKTFWLNYLLQLYTQLCRMHPAPLPQSSTGKGVTSVTLGRHQRRHFRRSTRDTGTSYEAEQESRVHRPTFFKEDPRQAVEKGLLLKRREALLAMVHDPASAKRQVLHDEVAAQCHAPELRNSSTSAVVTSHRISQPSARSRFTPASDATVFNLSTAHLGTRKAKDYCYICKKRLYVVEQVSLDGYFLHRECFKCADCDLQLRIGTAHCLRSGYPTELAYFYCTVHFNARALEAAKPNLPQSKLSSSTNAQVKKNGQTAVNLVRDNVSAQKAAPSISHGLRSSTRRRQLKSYRCQSGATQPVKRGPANASDYLLGPIPLSGVVRGPLKPGHQRGIRDEATPSVSVAKFCMSGQLGMPEMIRREAWEKQTAVVTALDVASIFGSFERSSNKMDVDERYFAENELWPVTISDDVTDQSLWGNHSPPISWEEAVALCRAIRADALYRKHHPSEEEDSSSSEGVHSATSTTAALPTTKSAASNLPSSVYENVRWTLDKQRAGSTSSGSISSSEEAIKKIISTVAPITSQTTTIAKASPLPSSLSLSMSAKQRFCMEAPKPVSIDPRAFIAAQNWNRCAVSELDDCTEDVVDIATLLRTTAELAMDDAALSSLTETLLMQTLTQLEGEPIPSLSKFVVVESVPIRSCLAEPPEATILDALQQADTTSYSHEMSPHPNGSHYDSVSEGQEHSEHFVLEGCQIIDAKVPSQPSIVTGNYRVSIDNFSSIDTMEQVNSAPVNDCQCPNSAPVESIEPASSNNYQYTRCGFDLQTCSDNTAKATAFAPLLLDDDIRDIDSHSVLTETSVTEAITNETDEEVNAEPNLSDVELYLDTKPLLMDGFAAAPSKKRLVIPDNSLCSLQREAEKLRKEQTTVSNCDAISCANRPLPPTPIAVEQTPETSAQLASPHSKVGVDSSPYVQLVNEVPSRPRQASLRRPTRKLRLANVPLCLLTSRLDSDSDGGGQFGAESSGNTDETATRSSQNSLMGSGSSLPSDEEYAAGEDQLMKPKEDILQPLFFVQPNRSWDAYANSEMIEKRAFVAPGCTDQDDSEASDETEELFDHPILTSIPQQRSNSTTNGNAAAAISSGHLCCSDPQLDHRASDRPDRPAFIQEQLVLIQQQMSDLERLGQEKKQRLRELSETSSYFSLPLDSKECQANPDKDPTVSKSKNPKRDRKTLAYILDRFPSMSRTARLSKQVSRQQSFKAVNVNSPWPYLQSRDDTVEMVETDEVDPTASDQDQLLKEFLDLVSERDRLVNYEAELVGQLRQLELAEYQEELTSTYRNRRALRNGDENKVTSLGRPESMKTQEPQWCATSPLSSRSTKRKLRLSRVRKERNSQPIDAIASICPEKEQEDKLLLDIWTVVKERNAIVELGEERLHNAQVQDSVLNTLFNRSHQPFASLFPTKPSTEAQEPTQT